MTTEDVKKLLLKADLKARRIVAGDVIDEVTNFIPIATGDLRKSADIETKRKEVAVVYDDLPYTKKQYFANLRHLGTRGKYQSITSSRSAYPGRYRELRDARVLKRSRARWFDAITRDSSVQKRLAQTYVGAVKSFL